MRFYRNAASLILKDTQVFEAFHHSARNLGWKNLPKPSGGWSPEVVRGILTKIANAKGPLPLNLLEEQIKIALKNFGSPALLVRNGKPEIETDHWKKIVGAKLDSSIPAVGKLSIIPSQPQDLLGTGWFIRKDIVVTNRHVAFRFAREQSPHDIKPTSKGVKARVSLNTNGEMDSTNESLFEVAKVVYVDAEYDVAFLKVVSNGVQPKPLELDENIPTLGDIATVIGYPGSSEGYTNAALAELVFEGIYNVKRVMVGEFREPVEGLISYTCPTLGGCSGAPVINLTTGKVVGVHSGGKYDKTNFAVPARVVSKLFEESVP